MIDIGSNVVRRNDGGYIEQFHVCSCSVRDGKVYYTLKNVVGRKFETNDMRKFVEIGAAR